MLSFVILVVLNLFLFFPLSFLFLHFFTSWQTSISLFIFHNQSVMVLFFPCFHSEIFCFCFNGISLLFYDAVRL